MATPRDGGPLTDAASPERFRRVRALFQEAEPMEPGPREAFLEGACGGDRELEREVRSLLASSAVAEGLLEAHVAKELLALAVPPRRIGPYTLLGEIGRGGMGTVHLAERSDSAYESRVAIKLVSRGMDSELVLRRFRAERQILAGLAHPNIARLLDGGTTPEGLPYLVMEYVEGRHILEYAAAARLSVSGRVALFRQVCDAVSFAHAKLVVHLDIKPGNILVTADGVPKLLDFGLARLVDPSVEGSGDPTVAAHQMLTPEYASPEQMRGERVTTASDVYSLGVVLHRLLGGDPASAEVVRRGIGEDLGTILEKALRAEPERRYASVEQLSEDLRRHLEGLPVLARRDTFRYRARKFVQRHAAAVAAAVLVAAAVGGAAGLAFREARRARRSEALAQKRFTDLRALARTLMYEIHDGVQPLPGSTPVRALLVATSLRYLDALARDAGSDRALMRELADGYTRIGDVQGGQNQGNLGDTSGALASYERSLAIREALARSDPASVLDRERLSDGLTKNALALIRTGRLDAALSAAREAVALRPPVAGETEVRGAARAYALHALGDALLETGDLAGALESYGRETVLYTDASASHPRDRVRRGRVLVGFYKTGAARCAYGEYAAALPDLRNAAALGAELVAEEPGNTAYERYLTFSLGTLATAESGAGERGSALLHFARALALRESMVTADPRNANLAMFLGALRAEYGEALAASGSVREALALLDAALPALEEIARRDPGNVEAGYQSAVASARRGRVREATGAADAARDYATSLAAFDALAGAVRGFRARERDAVAAALARCAGTRVTRPSSAVLFPASPR